jgi:DNA-binding NtrC family response regulator
MRIVILDDDPPRELLDAAARAWPAGDVRCAAPTDGVVDAVAADGVVVALRAPGMLELVRALRARRADLPILALGTDDAAAAVAAMKAGATDYVAVRDGASGAGVALDDALARLTADDREQPARRRPPVAAGRGVEPLGGLVGRSAAIEHVREMVQTAARTEAHVLIEGETGTGKEVVARAIHALGRRAAGPFVPVNCAAVPETLAESEFFGHARGAFTGALQDRAGVVQLADRGTLFLDEVEDLSPTLQAKLLRVVQDREIRPVGGSALRRIDVRLVAAANRDLARMVDAGTFRQDLYYRLRVLAIHLPPLRERREDIPLLVEHFVARFNRRHGTAFTTPASLVLRPLLEHTWPGNVRELENALESLLVLAQAGGTSLAEFLGRREPGFVVDERARILRVLEAHRWNRQRAAAALGISRVTLWRRMERHGIRDPIDLPAAETA